MTRFIALSAGARYMIGLSRDDILYTPLPLYHTAGGLIGVGQLVFFGNQQVIRRKFSASQFWTDCIKYKVTFKSLSE
ncbi:unnamed protein product [Protopolystoma xenopodis]|uniref:AMP-dependent synthetase/ligase domain-containing protein n=1 Tax=Protopolystoma xenopodis TaxID=117903 RepID=A0A3S5BLT8_9PLAT|nr:unnamed protein product [Protopolystoma xenopodis]